MKQKEKDNYQPGKYLCQRDWEWMQRQNRSRKRRLRKQFFAVMVLLLWDGVLLYMIITGRIEVGYGAIFVAVVSLYAGYQMK